MLPPLHLVPIELLEAASLALAEGDRKNEPGDWRQKDRAYFVDRLAHAIAHLLNAPWDESEDHLGHAAADVGIVLWGMRRGIVTHEDFRRSAVLDRQPPARPTLCRCGRMSDECECRPCTCHRDRQPPAGTVCHRCLGVVG